MKQSQYVGMIWVILGIVYGVGGAMLKEQWWWIIGAAIYAIVAVTTPVWRTWLPGDPA